MAKFTETLADYLEGGRQLPSAFSKIEGFDLLFKMKYIDREIGFETEDLFSIKLELTANLYIEQYTKQIKALTYATTGLDLPVRTQHSVVTTTSNLGEQISSISDRPINAEAAKPSSITKSEPTTNTSDNTSDIETKGFNSQMEAYEMVTRLNNLIEPLIVDLLAKFKHLFMLTY